MSTPVVVVVIGSDAVLAQMLPPCAIKGGGALKFRYGDAATRFTRDLDAARASDLESFIAELSESLEEGWEGFTGTVVPRPPAHPEGVPDSY
ncbi:MAG: nucleotidyl transferase AbiEii/AbiGii toxin family protein, partial [Eggerthellaceae bacterium]|nr:nucleotidyl transferase AbiEii/AbiGii toxin family protein [Eggerthellaceae bacterium]